MEAQNNNSFWFNQTEQKNFHLLYISLKRGNSDNQDKAIGTTNTSNTCVESELDINNTTDQYCGISAFSIPYSNFNPANPEL